MRTRKGLTKIDSTAPHLDIVASRTRSYAESSYARGHAESRFAEIESERANTEALANVETHGEFVTPRLELAQTCNSAGVSVGLCPLRVLYSFKFCIKVSLLLM